MTDHCTELQNSLKVVCTLMRTLLDNKPTQKQVVELQLWEEKMKPFRMECVRIHYELIELNKKEQHATKTY